MEQATWESLYSTPNCLLDMPSATGPGELFLLGELARDADVTVITSWPSRYTPSVVWQTRAWMQKGGLEHLGLLCTSDKARAAQALELTHFIDDYQGFVTQVLDGAPACKSFVLTRPYNPAFRDDRAIRVETVGQFIETVRRDLP